MVHTARRAWPERAAAVDPGQGQGPEINGITAPYLDEMWKSDVYLESKECMQKRRSHRVFLAVVALGFVLAPAFLLLLPQQASGTAELMKTLPAYKKYQCQLCHSTATPTVEIHPLNVFGRDFLANNNVWNETLALKNSDGDRCSNGSEIGDRDGDGVFDDGEKPEENSNPGDPADCTAPVDEATWGIIKEIFSQEIQQYMLLDASVYQYEFYFP